MEIEEVITKYIRTELTSGAQEIGGDTNLIGLIDSTAVMELVVWIESTFGFSVEIDAVTPENFGTVNAIAAFVRQNASP
jgi:acyl carrier protein